MQKDIYISRGGFENVHRSIVEGIDRETIEKIIGLVPDNLIDSYSCIHLWGVPPSPQTVKAWMNASKNDILVILSTLNTARRKTDRTYAILSIIKWKYPENLENPQELKHSIELSRVIWKPYKRSRGRGILNVYPYLLFLHPNVVPIELAELAEILGLTVRRIIIGYRQSLQKVKNVKPDAYEKLYKKLTKVPELKTLYRLLEETYIEISQNKGWHLKQGTPYGYIAAVGNKEIWGTEGLFEILNKKLERLNYRKLTWNEFREYLRSLDTPAYYGKVKVSWLLSPNGKIEPLTISFFKPTFI